MVTEIIRYGNQASHLTKKYVSECLFRLTAQIFIELLLFHFVLFVVQVQQSVARSLPHKFDLRIN